jgi:hypothetical protein
MSNLTDLEICKRIAKIDGVEHASDGIGVRYWYEEGAPAKNYNPLTDDALCFRLMVKYEISIINIYEDLFMVQCKMITVDTSDLVSINKAICLAIIESKEPKT